jgi:hypothetical protein
LFGELGRLIRFRFHLGSIGGVEPSNRQKKCGENGAKVRHVVRHFTFITVVLVAALISERPHNEGIACHLYIGLWSNAFPSRNAATNQRDRRMIQVTLLSTTCESFKGGRPTEEDPKLDQVTARPRVRAKTRVAGLPG